MKERSLYVFYFALLVGMMLPVLAGGATHSEPARRSFVSAARRGDITVMRLWLMAGASVNTWAPEEGGERRLETPLRAAIRGGQAGAARFLLERGAEVHAFDLLFAVEHGTAETRDLILKGGHGRRACQNPNDGGSRLLSASEDGHEEVVRLLLSCGAGDGSAGAGWGVRETALRRAIINKHRGVVAALLEAGANVNHLSQPEVALGGITVLQVALNHQDPEIIALVRRAGAK